MSGTTEPQVRLQKAEENNTWHVLRYGFTAYCNRRVIGHPRIAAVKDVLKDPLTCDTCRKGLRRDYPTL